MVEVGEFIRFSSEELDGDVDSDGMPQEVYNWYVRTYVFLIKNPDKEVRYPLMDGEATFWVYNEKLYATFDNNYIGDPESRKLLVNYLSKVYGMFKVNKVSLSDFVYDGGVGSI